jgi:hypothetical protein
MNLPPLLERTLFNDATYADRKKESSEIDDELGYEIANCETLIRARASTQENWARLSPQIFQTPYGELAEIIRKVDPDSTYAEWIDLGAAYGRLGIVLAALRPHARFLGYELEPERVEEGNRIYRLHRVHTAELCAADLATEALPIAPLYFIYDFGTPAAVSRVLESLREIAQRRSICVIGRGRRVRDLIEKENPWLSGIVPPVHEAHFSIYRSGSATDPV